MGIRRDALASPIAIKLDADLSRFNTLRLPARAAGYARILSADALMVFVGSPEMVWPRFVLGGGSNLVLAGDFDGLILHVAIAGRALVGEDADAWYVQAGAGENWHEFVQWTLEQGWPGLETCR